MATARGCKISSKVLIGIYHSYNYEVGSIILPTSFFIVRAPGSVGACWVVT